MSVMVPLRTMRGLNDREHPMKRHRRVASEKDTVWWCLRWQQTAKPALPCTVVLTRIGPSNGLDDDNLAGSLKAVRDAVAKWLGCDDRHQHKVRYEYQQKRGADWFVGIEFGPPGPQIEMEGLNP